MNLYDQLFKLEALLLEASELADVKVLSFTDLQNLKAMTVRVQNRANRAVEGGAVRPDPDSMGGQPVPFAVL